MEKNENGKKSYELRANESVDDGSPFWVASQKSTEIKIQVIKARGLKGKFIES